MEYFLGSLITLGILFVASKIFKDKINNSPSLSINYGQSYAYDLFKYLLPINDDYAFNVLDTQAGKHREKTTVRILMVKDRAYWIKDNIFYQADFENGEIIPGTTKQVDTMGMDKVQLEEIIFIVDQLTGGAENDSGYPGQSNL